MDAKKIGKLFESIGDFFTGANLFLGVNLTSFFRRCCCPVLPEKGIAAAALSPEKGDVANVSPEKGIIAALAGKKVM